MNSIIPVVGQVYKLKPDNQRGWMPKVATISTVNTGYSDETKNNFQFEEQGSWAHPWGFRVLEDYDLVTEGDNTTKTHELQVEQSTLYVLNSEGTNAFSLNVQAGFNDLGQRLTQEQCNAIALAIKDALAVCSPLGSRVDFTPLINKA